MAEKANIYSDAWCEIVFEDKNKEYGAFQLRRYSGVRHLKAMVFAIFLVVLSISTPLILKSILPVKKERVTEVTNLSNLKVEDTKTKEENKVDAPPPPELKSTIKFTAPIITTDDQVADNDDLKTQDELTQSKLSISTKDVIGKDDGTGVDIADLDAAQLDGGNNNKVEEQIYLVVEQSPEFQGDMTLNEYLAANIVYPRLAKESGITGTVYVQFVVEADGSISNVKLARGIGGDCDEEAIRVVKNMPRWKPGKQNGRAVRVSFTLPIKFLLM